MLYKEIPGIINTHLIAVRVIGCGIKISQSLFNPFAGILCKAGAPVGFVCGQILDAGGKAQNDQLVFQTATVFTHQKVDPDHYPVMKWKGSVHRFGNLHGNIYATKHPMRHFQSFNFQY